MKFKIALSVILALVVMVSSREISLRKRVFLVVQKGDVRIEHRTVTDKIGYANVKIEAKITTPPPPEDYAKKLFYKINGAVYGSADFLPETGAAGSRPNFVAYIPAQPKGKVAHYYIVVEDKTGNKTTLPDRIQTIDPPFMLKFKGEVPAGVILPHVIGMTAVLFFAFLASLFAIDIFLDRDALTRLASSISFLAASVLIGGILFGAWVTHYAFGGYWEGIPMGWDITDNKTAIIFLYWLIILFLMKGTLFQKDERSNLMKPSSLAAFTIIGTLLTVLLYLVPHSVRL